MKTIIEMAREAGIEVTYDPTETPTRAFVECWIEDLERLVELVRADEREACAKVCEDLYKKWVDDLVNDTDDTADSGTPDCVDCAVAIRARGNT